MDKVGADFSDLVARERAKEEKAAEYKRKITAARAYVVRGMYSEAKAIYDGFIDDDPDDMDAYMGYIRLATKNYTVCDGEEIDNNIRIAMQISGAEDLSQFDVDYAAFDKKRKQYLAEKAEVEKLNALLNIGDYKDIGNGYITFGAYPQSKKSEKIKIGELFDEKRGYYLGSDNNLYAEWENNYYKVEPIMWEVLSCESECFIVSDMILDQHRFDGSSNNYANSEIRSWLNGEFYNKAFNDNQKSKIVKTNVDNSLASTGESKNQYVCFNTRDKMFLLSRKEVKQYFRSDAARQKNGTDYAKARNLNVRDNGNSWWWLRTPLNHLGNCAYGVLDNGDDCSGGVHYSDGGVVCALRIKP